MNGRPLNIVNAMDVTDWVKAFTWGDTPAAVRSTDIRSREFVANNTDTVAKMMCHAYIKKNYLAVYARIGWDACIACACDGRGII